MDWMEFAVALGSITFINLILSGDNAVIIALASRNLPPKQRKQAIMWGSGGAVVLRILLTLVAAYLLQIPFVQFVGGLALLYIAIHLLGDDKKDMDLKEAGNLKEAIKVILFADLVMSLDNVLAIAGIAQGHFGLLVIGLAMSIPLVVFGSQLLMNLMDRFPIIIYIGAAILGWTAAKMIVEDAVVGAYLKPYSLLVEASLTGLVLLVGYYLKVKAKKAEEAKAMPAVSKDGDN